MQRERLTLEAFLEDLLASATLLPAERERVRRLLGRRSDHPAGELRDLVENLISRGRLLLLDRSADRGDERLLLRDPDRRLRYRLHLPRPVKSEPDRIELPLEGMGQLSLGAVAGLLSSPTQLMDYDRILGPREVIARLERFLVDALPCAEAHFHAIEMPADAAGPTVSWDQLPLERRSAESLALRRDHFYLWNRADHGVSRLALGLGEDGLGWRGCLIAEGTDDAALDLDAARRALVATEHFNGLLSTVIRLQGLIFYDFLTGVYNRSYYEDRIERETQLAKRRDEPMALLLADVDDFKAFNTRFGYEGGDRVLATVACVLKAALRGTDTLARYGGEEFVIILAPPVSREETEGIAERLRSVVEEESYPLPDLDGEETLARVTVSLGGAFYPQDGATPHELWTTANREVLRAKRQGKNQVCLP